MNPRSHKLLLVTMSIAFLALSASMAWAAVNDFESRGLVAEGVTVAGKDLSGMNESEARQAIEMAVSAPLMRPVTANVDGKSYSFDPRDAVSVNVEDMLDQAYRTRKSASFLRRLGHDIARMPLPAEVKPTFEVDSDVLTKWLKSVAAQVDRPAVNAGRVLEGNRLRIRKHKTGRKTDLGASFQILTDEFSTDRALNAQSRVVTLPVSMLIPKVTEKSMGKTIVVDLSERRIWLYKGAKLEITYRCAIGTPAYPTPTGTFKIVNKRYMPSWSNPAPNGWGSTMPASIPPGPGNPLGTRALDLSAPGIRFHGTTKDWSVGTAASHGCMRMHRRDIEDFYPRVPIGTPVYILR